MFERFTDRARRVCVLAQEEARILRHNYIGTEHILLGLIREGEGVACKALTQMGLSHDRLRARVEEVIGTGMVAPSGHVPFTPRAKKVLELSLREALQLGHNYIGTEHILLGIIREGEGVGSQVLVSQGAELTKVRQVVIQLISGYDPAAAQAEEDPQVTFIKASAQTVQTSLSDEEFDKFKDQLRYEVGDIFTGKHRHYPLIWEGRRLVGIDWDNGS